MHLPLAILATAVAVVVGIWYWLGQPMPVTAGAAIPKLECVSYAPFRGTQSPLEPGFVVPPAQIEDDLKRLAAITPCIRTYSVANGLDQVPALARKAGLKVLQGIWLTSDREFNRRQIAAGSALVRDNADVIGGVVIGNEVLLRGELSATDLGAAIRQVKTAVGPGIRVTYADVWEFWMRNPALLEAVDFLTIHILPYWEDDPVPAAQAAAHVDSIRAQVAARFPGKEILIGETGWPSHGRMREAALPSPYNQARVIQDILAAAAQGRYHVNVIEAFDQPWKRRLEGTVGGYWGLLDDAQRGYKFDWGKPVSNHPYWIWQAVAGAILAVLGIALSAGGKAPTNNTRFWVIAGVIATSTGVFVPWAFENMLIESLGTGGWVRSGLWVAAALAAPFAVLAARANGIALPNFAAVLGPARTHDRRALALGLATILTSAVALEVALGLVFDPRYRDFPFAAFTAAVLPLLLIAPAGARAAKRALPETLFAAVLAASVIYIVPNETRANWQALWLSGVFLALAWVLFRARDAQSPE